MHHHPYAPRSPLDHHRHHLRASAADATKSFSHTFFFLLLLQCVDDVAFVDALLDTLSETYCLDLDRLYATGFSNGGMFAWQAATSLAHRFAAVAPGGGQPFIGFVNPPDLRCVCVSC
jgi:predicted esterase